MISRVSSVFIPGLLSVTHEGLIIIGGLARLGGENLPPGSGKTAWLGPRAWPGSGKFSGGFWKLRGEF